MPLKGEIIGTEEHYAKWNKPGGSLFILMVVSLAVQKLFILIKSHLFIFSFISLVLGDTLARTLLYRRSEILLPMFSDRTLWYRDLYLNLLYILSLFWGMV